MYLKLAWRNIWRNKARTLITAASIFFAVLLCSVQSAIQDGTYDRMIENVVGFYTGYLQIHQKGYWEEKVLDNAISYDGNFDQQFSHNEIESLVPRLENFALISSEERLTRGALVSGIDPAKENNLTNLSGKLIKGNFLKPADSGILLPSGLADKLNVNVQDTVVIIGQGFHGATAAGKYPVRGIIKFPTADLNDAFAYITLAEAQSLFNATGLVTTVVVDIKDQDKLPKIEQFLQNKVQPSKYELMNWKEMMPELVQGIEADKAGAFITKGILYMIMTFGIFGTVLMMTAERQYEFGVLVALGMKKAQLSFVMFLEILMIAAVGVALGMAVSIPLAWVFKINPIELTGNAAAAYERMGVEPVFPASVDPVIFLNQGLVVFIIAVIIGIYPVWNIAKLDPVNAMKR